MRRRTPQERYEFSLNKQKKKLEEFADHETQWANDLLYWYKLNDLDIPDDQYRACAFFINKEFQRKAGSLTLLYETSERCIMELPKVTRENAFDLLSYRFKLYAKTLEAGGF